MKLLLLRHGATQGSLERRYAGTTDLPLSEEGRREAEVFGRFPAYEEVYVTPLQRTKETAAILFPGARQIVIEDFREMDFGAFENRTADEMENDAAYRAWVDGGCLGRCPGGENLAEFNKRVRRSFEELIRELRREDKKSAAAVVHGGTLMAILSGFDEKKGNYFYYHVPPCRGWECEAADEGDIILRNVRAVDHA